MKVYYINILLFALPLNILEHNQRNHKSPTSHTYINRSLCECDIYMPNYNSDPQMKKVMDNFSKQTQQRFREYDERMKTTRQKCKDRCDKDIQKIILKDKLEKQMAEQLTTLETKIYTDDIPTCICEKSLADKTEKFCLNCGKNMGGIAPAWGLVSGIVYTGWKAATLVAAKELAITEATKAATEAGMQAVVFIINRMSNIYKAHEITALISIVTEKNFNSSTALYQSAVNQLTESCKSGGIYTSEFCNGMVCFSGEQTYRSFAKAGNDAYNETLPLQKALLEKAKVSAVESTYGSFHTAIIASIVAIVIIVLIMVIIYLILHYRRKKKMKKKLQYIKLLKE
ncbi:rifin PIR protein, putative [Plasmodium reichenowi]|uniref:Rifin PIR protein, putative n=1 Tax=Plasmodium reichenowi TaxID=5854 RepID=A0A2P9D4V6_PLARE|nr:rifin PIR protein, putative [Plasmodium reichenowi]